MSLVRCTHCNGTYHLGDVEVTHRYADCDMFKAPCCGRTVDSRPWKLTGPDYERTTRREIEDYDREMLLDRDGNLVGWR